MKKFFNEFLEFALKGNVLNLAVGVMIGAAFQGIVKSLTDNMLAPILGLFTKRNFDLLQFEILGAEFKYGAFITSVINFLIIAFVVFVIVKFINRVMCIGKKQGDGEEAAQAAGQPADRAADKTADGEEAAQAAGQPNDKAAAPETRECPYCMTQVDARAVKCPACTSDI
jgi:large conductance mechanosensitive channel